MQGLDFSKGFGNFTPKSILDIDFLNSFQRLKLYELFFPFIHLFIYLFIQSASILNEFGEPHDSDVLAGKSFFFQGSPWGSG